MSNKTDLAELYTAFFNRAPDTDGLAYWVSELDNDSNTLSNIASNWMYTQAEGSSLYPKTLSTHDFIENIYANILGRAADTEGLNYWTAQLDNAVLVRDNFVAIIINGAKANTTAQGILDTALINNKAAVGLAFANQGIDNTAIAAKVLTTVTADANSVVAAQALIGLLPANPDTNDLSAYNAALIKIAAAIGSSGDTATTFSQISAYLVATTAGKIDTTDLTILMQSIGNAALNPSLLTDPASAATHSVNISTPFIVSDTSGVLTIGGNSTDTVLVDLDTHAVLRNGVDQGVTAAFTDVDVSGYASLTVTTSGTVAAYAAEPSLTGINTKNVVDSAANLIANTAALSAIGAAAVQVMTTSVDDPLHPGTNIDTVGVLSIEQLQQLSLIDVSNPGYHYSLSDTLINYAFTSGLSIDPTVNPYTITDGTLDLIAYTVEHPTVFPVVSVSLSQFLTGLVQTFVAGSTDPDVPVTLIYELTDTLQDLETVPELVAQHTTHVVDSVNNLLNASDSDLALMAQVASVGVTANNAGLLTVAQATDLAAITTTTTWSYSLSGTVAAIEGTVKYAGLVDYTLTDETDHTLTLDVSGAAILHGADNRFDYHYVIKDTVTHFANSPVNLSDAQHATATATVAADVLDASFSPPGLLTITYETDTQASSLTQDGLVSTLQNTDIVSHFVSGDKINLTAFTFLNNTSSQVQTGQALGASDFAVVNGTWNSVAQTFTNSETGADSLVLWHSNQSTSGDSAIVLTGYVASASDLNVNQVT